MSFSLALILLLNFSFVTGYADESIDGEGSISGTASVLFVNLNAIYSNIVSKSLGFVKCTSTFSAKSKSYTIVLSCTLQRTDGNSGWITYKTSSETFTNTLTGTIEKSWYAPNDYAYRTQTKVQVKNSSGTVIETQTTTSSVIYK